MDCLDKDFSICEFPATAAETPPSGEFPKPLSHDVTNLDYLSDVKLELESAQLELDAAESMRLAAESKLRAAEAKRRAAVALRRDKIYSSLSDHQELKLDNEVSTRLHVAEEDVRPPRPSNTEVKFNYVPQMLDRSGNEDVKRIERLLVRMELPKCEIPQFDGSPLQYVLFCRQFDEQVESRVEDAGQRLTYLYHYCTGRAKEAIRGCLLYPANEGYKRARSLLKDLFGQRHLIVRAMLDEVTGPGSISTDADSLSSFSNKMINCVDALEQLGYVADLNSVSTIERVLNKLPRFMTVDWVKRSQEIYESDREPTFRDLCDFISSKARLHRNRYSYLLRDQKMTIPGSSRINEPHKRAYVVSVSEDVCTKCEGKHALEECKDFMELSVKDRWSLVSRFKLCFICLRSGHRANMCRNKGRCTENNCNQTHHRLLHQDDHCSRIVNASCREMNHGFRVSLGIIPVIVDGPCGSFLASALLDTGADASLIRSDLAERLGLKGKQENVHIYTPMGNVTRQCSRISFRVKSLDGTEIVDVKSAYTVPSILDADAVLPSQKVMSKWSHLHNVNLNPLSTTSIGILLGLDTPKAHWVLEQRRGEVDEPYADLTPLGWVLRGPLNNAQPKGIHQFAIHINSHDVNKNLRVFNDQDFRFGTTLSIEEDHAFGQVGRSREVRSEHQSTGSLWRDHEIKTCRYRSGKLVCLKPLGIWSQRDSNLNNKYSFAIDRRLQKTNVFKVTNNPSDTCDVSWCLSHDAMVNLAKTDEVPVASSFTTDFEEKYVSKRLLWVSSRVTNAIDSLNLCQKLEVLSADIKDTSLRFLVPACDTVSTTLWDSLTSKETVSGSSHDYPTIVFQPVIDSFCVKDSPMSQEVVGSNVLVLKSSLSFKHNNLRLMNWLSSSREVLRMIPSEDRISSVENMNADNLQTQLTSSQAKWQHCRRVLRGLQHVSIPRWYSQQIIQDYVDVELHIFGDASEVGYGCVDYFRFVGKRESRCVQVMAKSRVSPLKAIIIPRLELTAALVAIELSRVILREIKLSIREKVFWTDSAVLLYYLKKDKDRFSTFVANRVFKIEEYSDATQWRHIAGKSNLADIASRGIRPYEKDACLWFEGPVFLRSPGQIASDGNSPLQVPKEEVELKSAVMISSLSQRSYLSHFERLSSWYVLSKCVAWILWFKRYLLILVRGSSDMSVRVGRLTVEDLRFSCKAIVKLVQLESFGKELEILRSHSETTAWCITQSPLRKLYPIILDELLCVGGRLQWTCLSEAAKHPIILPSRHFVTDLIIRKGFWIIRDRSSIRCVIGRCLRCRRESARPCYQQMAPLPKERSYYTGYAFAHVGVDYFGPIYVKRGRVEGKRWFDKTRNLKHGDLVSVIDDNYHRNQWPLGVVNKVVPGTDGLVREIVVRTLRAVLRRDVRKLCLLEGSVS